MIIPMRIDFKFSQRISPLQAAIYRSVGHGYCSPESLKTLFYIFEHKIIACQAHQLLQLNVLKLSISKNEFRISDALVQLIERVRSDKPLDLGRWPDIAAGSILDDKLAKDLFVHALEIPKPGPLIKAVQLIVVTL
ncbi:MAG: hypothetical protein HQK52_23100 [Oligoflexia bacterium]|nr:hypothetical protein [Oligoflexia bacterium]